MRRWRWLPSGVIAVVMALLLVNPGSANAASGSLDVAAGSAADPHCYTQLDGAGPVGGVICGTISVTMRFNDGTKRMFIIGWDRAVWNILRYPNGTFSPWRSLGGWAQGGVYAHTYDSRYSNILTIRTIGRDGRDWCRALNGSWGSWHLCT